MFNLGCLMIVYCGFDCFLDLILIVCVFVIDWWLRCLLVVLYMLFGGSIALLVFLYCSRWVVWNLVGYLVFNVGGVGALGWLFTFGCFVIGLILVNCLDMFSVFCFVCVV